MIPTSYIPTTSTVAVTRAADLDSLLACVEVTGWEPVIIGNGIFRIVISFTIHEV